MNEMSRNRLIGGVLLLFSLPFFWVEVGRGLCKIVSFGAGALLGFSAVLVVTGRFLWNSRTEWTSTSRQRSRGVYGH